MLQGINNVLHQKSDPLCGVHGIFESGGLNRGCLGEPNKRVLKSRTMLF